MRNRQLQCTARLHAAARQRALRLDQHGSALQSAWPLTFTRTMCGYGHTASYLAVFASYLTVFAYYLAVFASYLYSTADR